MHWQKKTNRVFGSLFLYLRSEMGFRCSQNIGAQHILGSCSPEIISTMRVLPMLVFNLTMPG